jgi:DNA-binding NtrC family response regulator
LKKKKILAVDDQTNTLKVLAAILTDEGYEVVQARSGQTALRIFQNDPGIDLVLSDLKMPHMDGLQLYLCMREICDPPPFIIMTAFGTVKSAVGALKEGVTNYLIKPLDFEELAIVIEKAIHEREMSREILHLKKRLGRQRPFHNIIGESRKMLDIFNMVRTVGSTDASVLIYGETGTGKELLARALHLESRRREKQMVCINSAALTESLLEAELFGHVRGAFTGAVGEKKGRLEMADGGTLFLDEIGHMSLNLQSKLLRFLQDMTFEPVGGTEPHRVDVRIITATNRDLQEAIEEGRFLKDLLYRIEVVSLQVPPLRERKKDIPLLVENFVNHYATHYEKIVQGVDKEVMDVLTVYSWPGNVRELKNCLARAVILSKRRSLTIADLPEKILSDNDPAVPLRDQLWTNHIPEGGIRLREMEEELIRKTLKNSRGNKSLAAQHLGISRKTLYEKIERYGIIP